MKLTVRKTVSWDDRGRRLTGKVTQIMGDHVVVAVGPDKYIVNKEVLSVMPTTTRVASSAGAAQPRYQHDCDKCQFLGQDAKHDLYFCPQGGRPTVIARYGDEGHEYMSGLFSAHIEPLDEAKKRAVANGLLPREP
jgi:hypothetical protein